MLWALPAVAAEPESSAVSSEEVARFEEHIRPVLVTHCYACHSAAENQMESGLALDSREALLRGGERGPAIVPREPDKSLLLRALRHQDLAMPPEEKLSAEVVRQFEIWIERGAYDPRNETRPAESGAGSVAPSKPAIDWEEARQFWAFQPPRVQELPEVHAEAWPQQRIDWFLLAAMEEQGLAPAPEADRATWLRRLSFTLVGLPPTPADLAAFCSDTTPAAYEHAVDRLLASPQFGEHWARLWLDLARYGEDQAHIVGDDRSLCYPNAYKYRDWVIDALNRGLPYTDFIRLQLAADKLAPHDAPAQAALGFLGLGPKYYDRGNLAVMAEEWADRVDVVGQGLLGLTIACARCHDHKYDPITTADYYALAGVFASTQMFNQPLDKGRETNDQGQAKNPEDSLHVVRDGEAKDLPIYIRGDVKATGAVVPRRFLELFDTLLNEPLLNEPLLNEPLSESNYATTKTALTEPGQSVPASNAASSAEAKLLTARWQEGSGRTALAESIVDPRNPLTSRVLLNRLWAGVFGQPLVATPSNFGALGQPPTHPELLDDLAARFVRDNGSWKSVIRELVLSAAFRQSSLVAAEQVQRDPANRWLSRMNRRRLSIEQWRDQALAVNGQLEFRVGGPSIEPEDPHGTRRTVYSRISRLKLNPFLAMFDFPDPNNHAAGRATTTTPLQKLFLLNSPFAVEQAQLWARYAMEAPQGASSPSADTGPDSQENSVLGRAKLDELYRRLLSRPATDQEWEMLAAYWHSLPADRPTAEKWSELCHVLLISNESLFLD